MLHPRREMNSEIFSTRPTWSGPVAVKIKRSFSTIIAPRQRLKHAPASGAMLSSDLQHRGAVAELILLNPQLGENGQQQIRHRRLGSEDQASALQASRSAARKDEGQRLVIVLIAVAHAAPIKNQGMMQKIS